MSAQTDSQLVAAPASVELQAHDLVAITSDVWSCFLDEEVYPMPEDTADLNAESVLASVGIVGAWGGHVLLELPMAGAETAAKRMLGLEEVTALEIVDALGELTNMVGGNVKSLLPPTCHLGLPMVVKGTVAPVGGTDTIEICRAFLGWADTTVRVSVWAKTNRDRNG